jgi:hypothetical protein
VPRFFPVLEPLTTVQNTNFGAKVVLVGTSQGLMLWLRQELPDNLGCPGASSSGLGLSTPPAPTKPCVLLCTLWRSFASLLNTPLCASGAWFSRALFPLPLLDT